MQYSFVKAGQGERIKKNRLKTLGIKKNKRIIFSGL
jgi:hypothetical protein